MVGKRKHRIAKKMSDGFNRRRAIIGLMLRAIYTPLMSEQNVRVVKSEARRYRLPMLQCRVLFAALLKHKRAAYQGVLVRIKPRDGFMQTVVVHRERLDAFIRDNQVYSYRDDKGETWLEQPKLLT
jgi:hypothetical protein